MNSGSSNDDARYSNSVATDINDNLFAVGYSKRNGYAEGGSAGNKIFVVTDASAATQLQHTCPVVSSSAVSSW
ncbi:DUF3466 family protein [Vibrio chagasii]|nr:DUF3466 family protein [Vibrio chagasii]